LSGQNDFEFVGLFKKAKMIVDRRTGVYTQDVALHPFPPPLNPPSTFHLRNRTIHAASNTVHPAARNELLPPLAPEL